MIFSNNCNVNGFCFSFRNDCSSSWALYWNIWAFVFVLMIEQWRKWTRTSNKLESCRTNGRKHRSSSAGNSFLSREDQWANVSFFSRQTLKPDSFITTRQSVVVTNDETTYTRSSDSKISSDDLSLLDQQNLYPRLPTNESNQSSDVRKLHSQVKPTDVELLYARLPADTLAHDEHGQQPLTDDQRLLHAKVIGAALKR